MCDCHSIRVYCFGSSLSLFLIVNQQINSILPFLSSSDTWHCFDSFNKLHYLSCAFATFSEREQLNSKFRNNDVAWLVCILLVILRREPRRRTVLLSLLFKILLRLSSGADKHLQINNYFLFLFCLQVIQFEIVSEFKEFSSNITDLKSKKNEAISC